MHASRVKRIRQIRWGKRPPSQIIRWSFTKPMVVRAEKGSSVSSAALSFRWSRWHLPRIPVSSAICVRPLHCRMRTLTLPFPQIQAESKSRSTEFSPKSPVPGVAVPQRRGARVVYAAQCVRTALSHFSTFFCEDPENRDCAGNSEREMQDAAVSTRTIPLDSPRSGRFLASIKHRVRLRRTDCEKQAGFAIAPGGIAGYPDFTSLPLANLGTRTTWESVGNFATTWRCVRFCTCSACSWLIDRDSAPKRQSTDSERFAGRPRRPTHYERAGEIE